MSAKKPAAPTPAERVKKLLRCRELGKRRYEQADAILQTLLADLKLDEPVDLGDGRTARLVDSFAKGNVAWGHGAVRRYDVKVEKARPAA